MPAPWDLRVKDRRTGRQWAKGADRHDRMYGLLVETPRTMDQVAHQLRSAFATKDLHLLGQLLAADARWGDDDHPNPCRSRSDVVATFGRLLGEGVDGTVTEAVTGPNGVAVLLHVEWPNPGEGRGVNFYQSYLVANGLVTEIQRHDDRRSAVAAIS
jgi:hypothetical protein